MFRPIDQSYYDKRDKIKAEMETLDPESTTVDSDRLEHLRSELVSINEEIEEEHQRVSDEIRKGK